jgi:glyoxylase I family protein
VAGSGVDHFDLVVSDLERSLVFYCGLLEPLGYTRTSEIVGERGERVVYLGGSGGVHFSLRQAQTPGGYDRYRVGIHHVAFQASSRAIVDERLRWVRNQGAQIENDPKEYDYRPGYYAGFFYDPDGISSRSSTSRSARKPPEPRLSAIELEVLSHRFLTSAT